MSASQASAQIHYWREIHETLQRLAIAQASRDYELGCQLIAGLRYSVHLHLGFGSFAEYVERLFGLTHRQIAERLRVAKALEELPRLRDAAKQGTLCWSIVRELTRVATADTEAEWLMAARTRTAREVEQLVAGRQPGDRPGDPAAPGAERVVLRFDVAAEVAATWREALAELRRRSGTAEPLSEEDALLLMARSVLSGPDDEGRASYQIAMTVCESCGRGWQQSRGELVAVDDEVVEMCDCDAQHIGAVARAGGRPSGRTAGSARVEADVDERNAPVGEGDQKTKVSSDTHVGSDAHVGVEAPDGPGPESTRRPRRATQTIAPRVRRAVIRRQNGRCAVPGCRHSQYLDVHHLVPRSEGGGSGEDDLIALCGSHHRAAHRGYLIIDGRPSLGLRFRHADGTTYGGATSPAAVEVHAMAFDALRRLGYQETAVRRALQRASAHVGAEPSFQEMIRAALASLTA